MNFCAAFPAATWRSHAIQIKLEAYRHLQYCPITVSVSLLSVVLHNVVMSHELFVLY